MASTFYKLEVSEVDSSEHHRKGGMTVAVINYFVPSRSWVREDVKGSRSVLAHEQLHFDIAEVFARRLRKELSLLKLSCYDFKKQVSKIKKQQLSALRKMQEEYDETHRQKWAEWERNVKLWLEELKAYEATEVFIELADYFKNSRGT